MHGTSHSPAAGVAGFNDNAAGGPGVWGQSLHGPAGFFQGDVAVTGDIKLLGADCAEDFDLADAVTPEPGSVMVLDQNGGIRVSTSEYDRGVVGVVSGAGTYRPALLLDRNESTTGRLPLAMIGKVFCKVDAANSPIEVGDLLTSSAKAGYAMKATDTTRAFGAVIGKALQPCASRDGLIAIVVALQ